eukprot:780836-Amphidinium_carterae.1
MRMRRAGNNAVLIGNFPSTLKWGVCVNGRAEALGMLHLSACLVRAARRHCLGDPRDHLLQDVPVWAKVKHDCVRACFPLDHLMAVPSHSRLVCLLARDSAA